MLLRNWFKTDADSKLYSTLEGDSEFFCRLVDVNNNDNDDDNDDNNDSNDNNHDDNDMVILGQNNQTK